MRFRNPLLDSYESSLVAVLPFREIDDNELLAPRNYKTQRRCAPFYPLTQGASYRDVAIDKGFETRDSFNLTDFTLCFWAQALAYGPGANPLVSMKFGTTWLHLTRDGATAYFLNNSGIQVGPSPWTDVDSSSDEGDYFPVIVTRASGVMTIQLGVRVLSYSSGSHITSPLNEFGYHQPLFNLNLRLGSMYLWNVALGSAAISVLTGFVTSLVPDPLGYVFDDLGFIYGYPVEELIQHDTVSTSQQEGRSLRRRRNERQRRTFQLTNGVTPLCEWEEFLEQALVHTPIMWTPPNEVEPLEVLVDVRSIQTSYVSNKVVQVSLSLREI